MPNFEVKAHLRIMSRHVDRAVIFRGSTYANAVDGRSRADKAKAKDNEVADQSHVDDVDVYLCNLL